MIKMILYLMETVPTDSEYIQIAKGKNKYPENWSEFKAYLKQRYNNG